MPASVEEALYTPHTPSSAALSLSDFLRTGRLGGGPLLQSMQHPQAVRTPALAPHFCMPCGRVRLAEGHTQQPQAVCTPLLQQLTHPDGKGLLVRVLLITAQILRMMSLHRPATMTAKTPNEANMPSMRRQLKIALGLTQCALMQAQVPGSTWMAQPEELTPRGPPAAPGEGSPQGNPLAMPRVGSEAVTSPSDSHEDFCHERMGSQVWPSH